MGVGTASGSAAIARVVIDSPLPQLDRLFDYRIPAAFAEDCVPGVRVRVPLRSAGRIADAYVVEVAASGEYEGALSEIEDVISVVPVLAPEVWNLARRLADRAAGVASDVLRLAIPKRQVRVEKAWLAAGRPAPTPSPITPVDAPDFVSGRLAEVVSGGERVAVDAVPRLVPVDSRTDGTTHWVGHWAVTMAAAASQTLAGERSAILAVPDYRDREQLLIALEAVLPAERIVRMDAQQSNPDRYRSILSCRGGTPLVIVGNRSALYAPAARLGLIAVWDDGDGLHSEPLSPHIHTRDAALLRQEQQDCALMFVSHARSSEVQRLVELGWLGVLATERVYLPKVIPTLSQDEVGPHTAAARIPSTAWKQMRQALDHGPVLVQVARPGYAPQLACESCRASARCSACEGPLAQRSASATPACQWCGALATSWSCRLCEGTRLRLVGQGSVRTAENLGRAFPGIKVIIADGDRVVTTVGAATALVVATRGAEPIADGGYRGVLLLDGDRMLARESLRVAEDCLRWWANAIALAAPGAPTVLVGVGGRIAAALATWRLADFARDELADRRRLRFPPAVRVATITGSPEAVERSVLAVESLRGVDVLGPVENPDGLRSIVRFDYGVGAEVASAMKAEIIRTATSRRKRVPPGKGSAGALPRLKARFDDTEPFAD
ncbi:replication restart DNA helicase PriA [Homoserinimonas aerilata]|uniref:Probable replication restart protein PriA n=1 Tax=Homoserinimonas aerilata TaxID=1162970 RepID=A0A542YIS9_9MICO|nr:primosomal protein N' [Homoserinimonas aerilata]TQL47982.1 replication restart DNA helicase PriA [Homoserinimonas aerilata]